MSAENLIVPFQSPKSQSPTTSTFLVKSPEPVVVRDKVPPDLRRDHPQSGGKSERVRFQEQSLSKALPKSARVPVEVNPKLEGNTVQVHYALDKKGRVSDVHIQAGPGATPRDIELHARTVKSMKRYSGMSFHAQKLKDRLNGWVKRNGVPPVGSKAWEAKLEVEKLPHIISDRTERLAKGDLSPQERMKLEREVTHLEHQLEGYQKDFKAMDRDPGKGFVAAESAGIRPDLQNVLSQYPHLQKRQQEIAKITDSNERIRQSELLERELIRESMRQGATQFRGTYLGKPFPKGNIALTEVYLSNGTSFGTGSTSRVPGLAPKPLPKSQGGQFEPTIDSHTQRVMDTDSEYKVLSTVSERLSQDNSEARGRAYLYTERKPCESCDGVIQQFKEKYPNIDLDVFWDHPYP